MRQSVESALHVILPTHFHPSSCGPVQPNVAQYFLQFENQRLLGVIHTVLEYPGARGSRTLRYFVAFISDHSLITLFISSSQKRNSIFCKLARTLSSGLRSRESDSSRDARPEESSYGSVKQAPRRT